MVGEKKSIPTTEGFHVIEVKGLCLKTRAERFDIRNGDVIEIKATFASWSVDLR